VLPAIRAKEDIMNRLVKNHCGTYAVFKNLQYRVKLSVFDVDKVYYSVRVLDSYTNKNTSYSNGDIDYYGSDINSAMNTVKSYVPDSICPEKLICIKEATE
jgi:hypothetical protein